MWPVLLATLFATGTLAAQEEMAARVADSTPEVHSVRISGVRDPAMMPYDEAFKLLYECRIPQDCDSRLRAPARE